MAFVEATLLTPLAKKKSGLLSADPAQKLDHRDGIHSHDIKASP